MNALEELIALLDLEQLEVNLFRGVSWKDDRPRVFGGQVAGQALVAAGRTVERHGRSTRSTPTSCGPGDPQRPHRLRRRPHPGREVVHHPAGRGHPARRGDLQPPGLVPRGRDGLRAPDPDAGVARPGDAAPAADELEPPVPGRLWASQPIDIRYVDGPPWDRPQSHRPARQLVWIRADGTLPDDPVLHTCVVAYASDYTLLGVALVPHGLSYFRDDLMMASLDHAMWFHRPFRADEWLLYSQASPSASGGRGLAMRRHLPPGRGAGRLRGAGGADPSRSTRPGSVRRSRAERARAMPSPDGSGRPALRHGHHAHAGHAPGHGRRRGRRRRLRRGPDGQPPRGAGRRPWWARRRPLYVPSGTMGNQIALRLLARPGTEVLCAARAHIRQYEAAAAAPQRRGPDPAAPRPGRAPSSRPPSTAAAEGPAHHLPPLSLVAIENTHMPAGGVPWPPAAGRGGGRRRPPPRPARPLRRRPAVQRRRRPRGRRRRPWPPRSTP